MLPDRAAEEREKDNMKMWVLKNRVRELAAAILRSRQESPQRYSSSEESNCLKINNFWSIFFIRTKRCGVKEII